MHTEILSKPVLIDKCRTKNKTKQFTFIDLCAGIGGIRRGFELVKKFEHVLSAEIDPYACQTYTHLFGDNPQNDVTSDDFKYKVEQIDYDILLAGFPCQAFSIAGKREGFLDITRGTIFFDVADIIKRTRPKAFLLENVEGLISHNKGQTFQTILNILIKELGYHVVGAYDNGVSIQFDRSDFIRNAKNFGIPQNRNRTYIMGFDKKNIPSNYIFDNLPSSRNDIIMYNDLNDLLEFHANPKYYIAQGYYETLKKHRKKHESKGNGFGYEIVNLKQTNNVANVILATGGSGKERNLVYDCQSNITGVYVKGKKTPINSEYIRHMTPKEWGKLQGFINYAFIDESGCDNFSFPESISNTQQYKLFGNSVCIPVIESLAQYMYKHLINFHKD